MYRQHSSRPPKASKRGPKRSPSPDEEVIQRKLRSKRWRTEPRETEGGDSVVSTDEGQSRDIIDIINSTHDAKEDEVKSVEVADEGLDESDEDCDSSSMVSGPSVLCNASPKKPRPSLRLCSACHGLYQKAKKMKAPIKSKLLDNDPKSLTCDHWVLMKNWRPRRLPNAKGKLLIHIKLVKKRLQVQKGAKRPAEEGGESVCERPHTFLQRNLRRVRELVKKERKKKKRRKRTRDGSQGPRVAKQQRLLSNDHSQHTSISSTDDSGLHTTSGHSGSPGFECCSDQEVDDHADTNQTAEMNHTQVTLNTTKPTEVPPRKKAPNKTSGFRDLLAQLRGNSSIIVRETR